jgi:hypothetical protein
MKQSAQFARRHEWIMVVFMITIMTSAVRAQQSDEKKEGGRAAALSAEWF